MRIVDKLEKKILDKLCDMTGDNETKEHFNLQFELMDNMSKLTSIDDFAEKLNACTNDELAVINSRLTMIINTINEK